MTRATRTADHQRAAGPPRAMTPWIIAALVIAVAAVAIVAVIVARSESPIGSEHAASPVAIGGSRLPV